MSLLGFNVFKQSRVLYNFLVNFLNYETDFLELIVDIPSAMFFIMGFNIFAKRHSSNDLLVSVS